MRHHTLEQMQHVAQIEPVFPCMGCRAVSDLSAGPSSLKQYDTCTSIRFTRPNSNPPRSEMHCVATIPR
ncbi:hypothetical protein LPJGGPFB_05059 [Ensifer adhaerens]|nr:hypothetical protein [Ensifer adhaerens]